MGLRRAWRWLHGVRLRAVGGSPSVDSRGCERSTTGAVRGREPFGVSSLSPLTFPSTPFRDIYFSTYSLSRHFR